MIKLLKEILQMGHINDKIVKWEDKIKFRQLHVYLMCSYQTNSFNRSLKISLWKYLFMFTLLSMFIGHFKIMTWVLQQSFYFYFIILFRNNYHLVKWDKISTVVSDYIIQGKRFFFKFWLFTSFIRIKQNK